MKKLPVLAFVMAGGEGARLFPLTADRSKPSVPFGARYRIVDFVLSNLINSEIHAIYLLVQYKSQSLIEHIRKAWVMSPIISEQFVTVVPPQMRSGQEWFQGTADAMYQNINLILQHAPEQVVVFSADHVYRMDIRPMVQMHKQRGADVTIASVPVPLQQATSLGVMGADADGRVREFQEKPVCPAPMYGDPTRALASTGNYVFDTKVLIAALEDAHKRGENDFGKHVLPRLIHSHKVYAYDLASGAVPGLKSHEDTTYWRDVGTIDAYFEVHRDVLGLRPRIDIFNPQWPIYSSNYQGPAAKIISGQIENSIFAGGTVINGARVSNSILRREVVLEEDVQLDDCIIMDYTVIKRGARLKRVIVDNNNIIAAGERIGYDTEADRLRYHVTPSGIVVVPRGALSNRVASYMEHTG